jgi:hypothetical protein
MGTVGLFPAVKWPEREADHSPPSSAEVKECVELYIRSPIRLHGVMFSYVKHRLSSCELYCSASKDPVEDFYEHSDEL